jgi:hypothetical protein
LLAPWGADRLAAWAPHRGKWCRHLPCVGAPRSPGWLRLLRLLLLLLLLSCAPLLATLPWALLGAVLLLLLLGRCGTVRAFCCVLV